jgi:hypothetical protein
MGNQIYRKNPRRPWVEIKPSQALASIGIAGEDGLYAMRKFKTGEKVGRYVGKLMTAAQGRQVAAQPGHAGAYISDVTLGGLDLSVDGLQELQTNAEQMARWNRVLVDKSRFWPGMAAHKINDNRDTGLAVNTQVYTDGWVRAVKPIKVGEELLWSYGDSYWEGR